jgi:hypothetical protein
LYGSCHEDSECSGCGVVYEMESVPFSHLIVPAQECASIELGLASLLNPRTPDALIRCRRCRVPTRRRITTIYEKLPEFLLIFKTSYTFDRAALNPLGQSALLQSDNIMTASEYLDLSVLGEIGSGKRGRLESTIVHVPGHYYCHTRESDGRVWTANDRNVTLQSFDVTNRIRSYGLLYRVLNSSKTSITVSFIRRRE